jgi:hypothetical protein
MTTATQASTASISQDLETLRNAQTLITAAIQHAREEALELSWRDQLLGLRLRLEKVSAAMVSRELDQLEQSQALRHG